MRRIFLTGGSGYLGRNLIRHFVAQGVEVHAIGRSERSREKVAALGAVPFAADLSDVDALARAAEGCDVAIHSAAAVSTWGDLEACRRDNVQGTANVIAACQRAGVSRLVHVSSESVLMEGEPLVRVDEQRPIRPEKTVGIYSQTKGEAELLARGACSEELAVMVVRPRLIWGRDDTVVLGKLVAAHQKGSLRWLAGERYLTSTCHVANACEGIEAALRQGEPGGVYFLTDGEPVDYRDFVSEMLAAAGHEPPTRTIPRRRLWAAAGVLEFISRFTGKAPLISRQELSLAYQEVTVDDTRARSELGYVGRVSIAAGLDELRAAR